MTGASAPQINALLQFPTGILIQVQLPLSSAVENPITSPYTSQAGGSLFLLQMVILKNKSWLSNPGNTVIALISRERLGGWGL